MEHVNYKSDFDFILRLLVCASDGDKGPRETGWPDYDWTAKLYTTSKANAYTVSCIGGVCTNCFNDNGKIHVVVNDHRMGLGGLNVDFRAMLPNTIYPDGTRVEMSPQPLDIELVSGRGDCSVIASAQVIVPYIKGDKGDKGDVGPKGAKGDKGDAFTYADFTPQQIVDLQKPATEAAASVAALEQSIEAAESKREAAEINREQAEAEREDAEQLRAEEFAAWQSEIDGKQDALTTSADLAISPDNELSLTELAKLRLFIDQWDNACGKHGHYNPQTDLFELNGLTDITYEQALDIYRYTSPAFYFAAGNTISYGMAQFRTNLPLSAGNYTIDIYNLFANNTKLEIVRMPQYYSEGVRVGSNCREAFYNCKSLKTIINVLIEQQATAGNKWYLTFEYCEKLETVKIKNLYTNVSFAYSPLLSQESLSYIVNNRTTGHSNTITITVHPNVYAKLTGDTANSAAAALSPEELVQWQQVLTDAATKNISFATV